MRVACIGNMNNNMFSLVRYLRDRGIDAELVLLDCEQAHFHPSCDAYDLDYQAYTTSVDWGRRKRFDKVSGDRVRDLLGRYDYLAGCHTVPALAHKAGRKLDLFFPFGTDVYEMPFRQGFEWGGCGASDARRPRASGMRHSSRALPTWAGPSSSSVCATNAAT